jgi:DNA-binding NtrC family response regulator
VILVVDDDPSVGLVLTGILKQEGFHAVHALSAAQALDRVDRSEVEVVITDLRMPGMDGMALLSALKKKSPDLPVIMLTAHGTVGTAVEAMKRGASDFMLKPFEREEVVHTIRKALASNERAPAEKPPLDDDLDLLGESSSMRALRATLVKVAPTMSTVLLQGETGTGKELAARALHRASNRASGPFVVVNSAALPENLIESELFGHEKGAFTGATAQKPGRAELAHGGTLFLDEIGELPAVLQPKLLRLLQERELVRVGGTDAIQVDVRFVCATHRDLGQMVKAGTFREDLFYRLSVVPIDLPPLRERASDIPILVQAFLADIARKNGKRLRFDDGALGKLSAQPYPGNVRELLHVIERIVVLAEGAVVLESDVAAALTMGSGTAEASSPGSLNLADRRSDAERAAIQEALVRAKGNRSLAARLLGVSRRTLYNKLEELGFDPGD